MNTRRQAWAGFVGSRGERYLYTRGGAAYSEELALGEAETASFLSRLAAADVDVRFLSRLLYLARPRVQTFFRRLLPGLLRGASHVTTGKVDVSERGVRGKVLWPATLRLRSSGRGHEGTFVVRRAEKSSDVPENQLLRLYLTQVSLAASVATKLIGSGEVPMTIEEIRRLADGGLKEAPMRAVTPSPRANTWMHARAARHRDSRYAELSFLQREFDQVISYSRWDAVVALTSTGWFEPISDDDLFELYLLVLVLDILSDELGFGPPVSYGLLRSGRAEVAQFYRSADDARAVVYFDQSPSVAFHLRESRYRATLTSYSGIAGPDRRPDISIRFQVPERNEKRMIIEAKMTDDKDYVRESVYKCFGYLYDFAELWANDSAQTPKAILIVPEGVTPISNGGSVGLDLAISPADDRRRLATLLSSAFAA